MRLTESLATTEALAALFDDESAIEAMLRFEVALARAESQVGVIPASAAEVISTTAIPSSFDLASLARAAQRAGTPAIPLVKALTTAVRAADSGAARYVHWGATSQDVVDTALVLLLVRARDLIVADHLRLEAALLQRSEDHAGTVLLGRTLLQPAPPVTLGLKAAGWLAASRRTWARVESAFEDALVLQLGGSSGTLAALGDRGVVVGEGVARELGLRYPDGPWHTHRDRLASLVCALGVHVGSLGKMARDVSLLMQAEIGEVAEPGGDGRGGSSTMPHKRNPTACALTLAAAGRVPGLVASFLSGMPQEHERAVGGWQAEWPIVESVVKAAGLAEACMAEVAEGLIVNEERMRENIEATRGVVFAERAMILLGARMGRDVAHRLLEEATGRAAQEGEGLVEILLQTPEVTEALEESEIRSLVSPEGYLGVSEELRTRLLGSRPGKRSV